MGSKNTSWVRDRIHVSFGTKPICWQTSLDDDYPWYWLPGDEIVKGMVAALGGEEMASSLFSEQELCNYSSWLDDFVFGQSFDHYFEALIANDWDDRHLKLQHKNVSFMMIPIKTESEGITTGKSNVNYSYMFVVKTPGVVDSQGRVFVDCSLGGLYSNCDDLLLIDASGKSNLPTSAYHEMLHLMLRRCLDDVHLRDTMYGESEADQREELTVHFCTDNHCMLNGIYDFFKNTKLSEDADGCNFSVTLPSVNIQYGEAPDGSADSYCLDVKTSKHKAVRVSLRTKRLFNKKSKNSTVNVGRCLRDFYTNGVVPRDLGVSDIVKSKLRSYHAKGGFKYGKSR